MFRSNGTGFNYSNSSGWWNNLDYNCSQLAGRLINGDFNENGVSDDFMGLYSYGNQKSRTHVWNKIEGLSDFNDVNSSLGFPWVTEEGLLMLNRGSFNFSTVKNEIKDSESELKLNIYPNPVKLILTIESEHRPTSISLLNINGKVIRDLKYVDNNENRIIIDLLHNFIKKGVYLLKLKINNKTIIKKVIIE